MPYSTYFIINESNHDISLGLLRFKNLSLSYFLLDTVTDNVDDETTGTIIFSENFEIRYGHCHPMFFHGTLESAVQEACHRPAKDVS